MTKEEKSKQIKKLIEIFEHVNELLDELFIKHTKKQAELDAEYDVVTHHLHKV